MFDRLKSIDWRKLTDPTPAIVAVSAALESVDWKNQTLTGIAAAAGLSVFGAGFLMAKVLEPHAPHAAHVSVDEVAAPTYGHPRDARAGRAADTRPDGFAIWRQKLDTSGNTPRACLQMSKALDETRSYGDYVLISPELPSPPAVTVKGDMLCVAGLGFHDRRITLLKGLPARDGDSLTQNVDSDFTFGAKPPYVGFVGNGTVLPREEADGIAVETINVSSLSFEVWRVVDRNLVRKTLTAPKPIAEGDYDEDYGDNTASDEGSKIWSGKVAVQAGNGDRVTTVFPLGAVLKSLKPGAYLIKVRDVTGGRDKMENDQPAQARRWVLFTDMAMTTYSGASGLDVVVRALGSAHPLGGISVALMAQNGEELGRVRTDANGHAAFAKSLMKGDGALTPKMLMAYGPDEDFTATDLNAAPVDLSRKAAGPDGAGQVQAHPVGADAFTYTDRGIYRPGETVHLIALMRDGAANILKDRKGALVITRPSGIEAWRLKFDGTPQGFAGADLVLPRTAPRGQWHTRVELEGATEPVGQASFAVEDFVPQRLGVDMKADADTPLTGAAEVRPVRVNAHFLYGAVASGLNVTASARIKADPNPFSAYKDYRFGNEASPFAEKYVDLPATTTDGQGQALTPFAATLAGDTDQPLTALVTTMVFDPGGRPVGESATLRLRNKPLYLGAKIDAADNAPNGNPQEQFSLIAVNAKGQAVDLKGVHVRLISENVRYDWYQQDGKWSWRRTSKDVVVQDRLVDLNARTGFNFLKALEWGDYRLELEDPASHAKTALRFSPGWGGTDADAETPDFVRLSAGTRTYAQGDTVTLTLKAPYAGEAQIAVATDHIIDLKTVSVGDQGASIRLNTDASWGGGAYIMVSVIQPRDPVTASRPHRALGLIYVPLDPKSRKLSVAMDTGKGPRPPSKDGLLEIPLKVGNLHFGERAHVTLSVVDQGIVNLTKFQTPDPAAWYFGKRALGVEYRDDYGRLLDPNLGAPAGLNYGGDQLGGEGLTTTPTKTVALWSGLVETGLDGKAVVKVPLSKFNGELKLMAVAWTDTALGSGSDRLVVREPVVAQLDLPRFLAPGDKATATLELHNVDGQADLYQMAINGLKGLWLNFLQAFHLDHGQRLTQDIPVVAANAPGTSDIHLKLSGGGLNYEDSYLIETRSGWGPVTHVFTEQQLPGQAYTPPHALLDGFRPGSITMIVSYSPFRGIDPAPIARSLERYPYGCTEQIVSSAYPWVYVSPSLIDQAHADRGFMLLKQAVSKVLDRQSEDGAFGLWHAGDGEAEGWIGAYATDFLLEAQRQGAYVPQQAMDKALNAMREISRPDGTASVSYRRDIPHGWLSFGDDEKAINQRMRDRAAAYALYVMAKAGQGDIARLRWFLDVEFAKETSPLARAQVAAGLAMMGDKARARLGFTQALSSLGAEDRYNGYASPLRDLAGIVALAYESGMPDIANGLTNRLGAEVRNPDALNTQEQAHLLKAAFYMLRQAGPLTITAQNAIDIQSKGPLQRFGVGKLSDTHFVNQGSGPVWRTVSVTGDPLMAPGAANNGYSVDKAYYSMQGQRLDPSHIAQGDRVIVVITGRSSSAQMRAGVIDDALPAGLEIESLLTNEDTSAGPFHFVGTLTTPLAQEARDDRFIAAINTSSAQGFALAYLARAVTRGDFYLPGVEVKDFYRPERAGRTMGTRLQVTGH